MFSKNLFLQLEGRFNSIPNWTPYVRPYRWYLPISSHDNKNRRNSTRIVIAVKTWNLINTLIAKFTIKKVKVTLVQALRLCTGLTAHRGSRGLALPFQDYGTRRGCGVSVTPRPLFTPGKDPVPIVQEAGWAPGPVWTGAENLAATGIRSPDRPARSQSLYRLSYPNLWYL